MNYDDYLEYLNHMFLERSIDFDYLWGYPASTVDALTVL